MGLYLENGYLNVEYILNKGFPFSVVVGGRGVGKSYGFLKFAFENDIRFLYLRRTQAQADLINKPEFTPFKSLNRDLGIDISTQSISKYNAAFVDRANDNKTIGYTAALSTFANIRGFDASDVELLIYDEFIPERHERPIKEEGSAFFNAYETINRNRELNGREPLKAVCLANANDIGNPLFTELKLIRIADKMRANHTEMYFDKERGIALFMLDCSPISEKKENTALYRLTKGNTFAGMALDNTFYKEDSARIISRPIKEYKPIVTIGEITLYKHKSKNLWYCSTHRTGSCPIFGAGDTERARFKKQYFRMWLRYMDNKIEFEETLCEVLFQKYFK